MLPLFLSELAGGCLFMTGLCRTDHVSWKYFRLMGFVAFGLIATALVFLLLGGGGTSAPGDAGAPPVGARAVGAALTDALSQSVAWALLAAAVIIGIGLAVNTAQGEQPKPAQRIVALAAAGLTFAGGFALVRQFAAGLTTRAAVGAVAEAAPAGLLVPFVPLAGAVLGGVTAAMLLGHAYLTQTSMPIDPLRRLARLAIAGLAVRAAWTGIGALAAWSRLSDPRGDVVWLWLMLSVRVGVGLLVAGLMLYMAADCVRLRNTQSATGILYIAMVMVFLGELAAIELGRSFNLWM